MESNSLTRAQVRAIDRIAVEKFGLPAVVLMENAGRGAAEHVLAIARDRVARDPRMLRIAVVCGAGNNGGDGFVVARHVANEGLDVELFTVGGADQLPPEARTMRRVVERMGLALHDVGDDAHLRAAFERLSAADIFVDALLGTGFEGTVRPHVARVIDTVNALHGEPTRGVRPLVVALDVPSGLDCDSGKPSNATVIADWTVTFVAHKRGFLSGRAARYLGHVEIVSIGVPIAAIADARRSVGDS